MTNRYKEHAHMILADNSIDRIRILIRELMVFDNRISDPLTGEDMSLAKSKAVIRQMIEVTRKKLLNPLTHRGWVTDSALTQLDYLHTEALYEVNNFGNSKPDLPKSKEAKISDGLINWNL